MSNTISETLRETDRQVAVELGWGHFTINRPSGLYGHPPGGKLLSAVPAFTTDPAAADLVLKAIYAQWDYSEGRYGSTLYSAHITGDQEGRDEWRVEHEQYLVARCLAFLAARDATKPQPVPGEAPKPQSVHPHARVTHAGGE